MLRAWPDTVRHNLAWRASIESPPVDLVLQFLGALLLFAALGLGYWVWIRPLEAGLTLQGRGLLFLVLLTLAGGALGAPFWWLDKRQSFSWDLPPLASRMLAAA